jgi:non-homologous end joining protein Ku
MLKKKQAGKAVPKVAARAPTRTGGNVIDLLKRSLEMEKKGGRKSPPLQPVMPKAKKRAKARA